MLDRIERGDGDGRPERRGTRLAAELDRRLSGDAPLSDIISWWSEEWSTAMGVQLELSGSDEDPIPGWFCLTTDGLYRGFYRGFYGFHEEKYISPWISQS
jgi:hypothetical protein